MEGAIRGRGRNKRYWTPQEDEMLLQALLEISRNPKWKSENGFKSGYMNKLEEMLVEKIPNCGLKVEPHIESRLKHWSEKYVVMAEMLATTGFNWDSEKKLLEVEKSVYEEWIKTHKKAKGLFGVPFPHYEMLVEIYGKDRATRVVSESFLQAAQNQEDDLTRVSITLESDDDLNDDVEVHTETESESLQSASGSRKRKDPPYVKSAKKQRIRSKTMDEVGGLASSLNSATTEFGKVFANMNENLCTMAQVWRSEEERKKKIENESNKILDEVLKLDLSPSDALEVATLLMAEEHKLRVFYQAPTALKKQYVTDLLRRK